LYFILHAILDLRLLSPLPTQCIGHVRWVIDCGLTPTISWQEQVNFQRNDYDVRFVLDQLA